MMDDSIKLRKIIVHYRHLLHSDKSFIKSVSEIAAKEIEFLKSRSLERTSSFKAFDELQAKAESLIFQHDLVAIKYEETMNGVLPKEQSKLPTEAM